MDTPTQNQENEMSKEYPLYPALSDEAAEEAQRLMDHFKDKIRKVIDEVLQELYCDVSMYIESDHWANYRNELLDGFRNYNNRKIQAQYDFKAIRQAILKEHREDIIADLNQDLLEEIASLKETIEVMHGYRT